MSEISRWDVIAVIGDADELIVREAMRTKCSLAELKHARDLVDGTCQGGTAEDELPARMQRLVDLISVALAPGGATSNASRAMTEGRRHAA